MKPSDISTSTALSVGVRNAAVFPNPLTIEDRCDSCQAAAYVAVVLELGGTQLLFCGHHFAKHEVKLRDRGAIVHDERYRLSNSEVLRKKEGVSA